MFIAAFVMLILLLFILKRKRKTKDMNLLIYHNRRRNLQQETSQQWEKAKTHIERLLYEITEQQVIDESLNQKPAELSVDNRQCYSELVRQKHLHKMPVERAVESSRAKRSDSMLDVHELQAVADLAKRLQARNRHRVRS